MTNLDAMVRLRAFQFLEDQVRLHGSVLPRDVLAEGFSFEGTRVPLVGHKVFSNPQYWIFPSA